MGLVIDRYPMIDRYKKLIVNFPDCMIERKMRFIQLEYCKCLQNNATN